MGRYLAAILTILSITIGFYIADATAQVQVWNGDLDGSTNATKIVTGAKGQPLPTSGSGVLTWDGGAWFFGPSVAPNLAGQALFTNDAGTSTTWAYPHGDVDASATDPGKLTVNAIQGFGVSASVPSMGDVMLFTGALWSPTTLVGDVSITGGGVTAVSTVSGPTSGDTKINSQTGNVAFAFGGTTGAYFDRTSGDVVLDSANASALRLGSYWSGGLPAAGFSGIYAGANASTPGATNYAFLGTTSRTFFGATNDLLFGINNAYSLYITANGAQWFDGFAQSLGGGTGVMGITDAMVVPTSAPTGGGVMYSQGGALKWIDSSGNVFTVAP